MLHSQDNPWASRAKWLTQALIISGTLNIGLLSTFVYFVLKDKQETVALELNPTTSKDALPTNAQLLRTYSLLPYQELLLRLENRDQIEKGLSKCDLALSCLVAFHHFDLDKALGSLPLQKRTLPFTNTEGQETIDIPVFPGLTDDQFHAILHFAKTEKWPLTSQGLFYELKRTPNDTSLLDAFCFSAEYHAVHTLLASLQLTREQTIALIIDGEWNTLANLPHDFTPDNRRVILLDYLNHHSRIAAQLLLDTDSEFVSKRLSDPEILTLLDLYTDPTPNLQSFATELLTSPRTDIVYKRAAAILYTLAGESLSDPYDHVLALQRFSPTPPIIQAKAAFQTPPSPPSPTTSKKKHHTVEPGDNLWKIARKYQVSVDELMRTNRLDTERLRPGKQLEIPDKAPKKNR